MNAIVNVYKHALAHKPTRMPLREMMAYNAQPKRVRFAIVSEKYRHTNHFTRAYIQKQANMQSFPRYTLTHSHTHFYNIDPEKRINEATECCFYGWETANALASVFGGLRHFIYDSLV